MTVLLIEQQKSSHRFCYFQLNFKEKHEKEDFTSSAVKDKNSISNVLQHHSSMCYISVTPCSFILPCD